MSTTSFFIELLVIGFSGTAWIFLLPCTLFGYNVTLNTSLLPFITLPLLSFVYVIGIVTDRLADTLFEKVWSENIKTCLFKNSDDYHQQKIKILIHSERLSGIIEYGRNRLRICRD